jgi:hypothetical protein
METTITSAFAAEAHASNDSGAATASTGHRRRGRRITTFVVAVVVGLLAGIGVVGSPASAAPANQWQYHDLIPNNGVWEMAIYYDGYGRVTQVVADLNANKTWDAWSAVENGYPKGWLLNTVSEFDGQWDALVSATGERWSNATGCVRTVTPSLIGGGYHSAGTQVQFYDSVYGMRWCYRSSFFTGVISAPIYENMLVTLTRLVGVAPYSYCYSYPTAVGCYGRNW